VEGREPDQLEALPGERVWDESTKTDEGHDSPGAQLCDSLDRHNDVFSRMLLYVFERVIGTNEIRTRSGQFIYTLSTPRLWLDPVYCPAVRRGEAVVRRIRNGLITPMSSSKKSRQPPSPDDDDDNTVARMMGSSMDAE
jgi:hypothetical protein